MGFYGTCGDRCYKNVLNKTDWCYQWRPPPFPRTLTNEQLQAAWRDEGLLLYADVCDLEIPNFETTTTATFLSSSTTTTTTTNTTTVVPTQEAHLAGGLIALVVILVLIAVAVIVVALWWYLWKRKRKRGSINSLPLKRYEDTNFLDNKARQNQCYTQSMDLHPDNKTSGSVIQGNQYGSFPPSETRTSVQYLNATNRNSQEAKVGSPVEFDKMNTSMHSGSYVKNGYDNDNFMNDSDQTGARSPGVDSQTPLFEDMTDGPALPNSVPNSKTSQNSLHNGDGLQRNGSLKKVPSPPVDMTVDKTDLRKKSDSVARDLDSSQRSLHNGDSLQRKRLRKKDSSSRLPPVDNSSKRNISDSGPRNSDSTRRTSSSSLRSPKKKKPPYLHRKSEPVEGIEDIAQDLAGNRQSV